MAEKTKYVIVGKYYPIKGVPVYDTHIDVVEAFDRRDALDRSNLPECWITFAGTENEFFSKFVQIEDKQLTKEDVRDALHKEIDLITVHDNYYKPDWFKSFTIALFVCTAINIASLLIRLFL